MGYLEHLKRPIIIKTNIIICGHAIWSIPILPLFPATNGIFLFAYQSPSSMSNFRSINDFDWPAQIHTFLSPHSHLPHVMHFGAQKYTYTSGSHTFAIYESADVPSRAERHAPLDETEITIAWAPMICSTYVWNFA